MVGVAESSILPPGLRVVSRFGLEVLSDNESESSGNSDLHESTDDYDEEHNEGEDGYDGECVQDIIARLSESSITGAAEDRDVLESIEAVSEGHVSPPEEAPFDRRTVSDAWKLRLTPPALGVTKVL